MDLDQAPGYVGQTGRRDRLVVDPGGGAARGRNLAHADQRLRHAVEQRLDPRLVGAVPNQRRVGPGADGQAESVDEQALAGAGLAGQDVQAGLEGDPHPVDQRQIVNSELGKAARDGR